MLFLALLILLFAFPLIEDYQIYTGLPATAPPIVAEYYSYFEQYPATVLSMDPVLAAYSDIKLIPFYDSAWYAYANYENLTPQADAVVYNPDALRCDIFECNDLANGMYVKLRNNFDLVFENEYDGSKKYIFMKGEVR